MDCNLRIEGERPGYCKGKAAFYFFFQPLTGPTASNFCVPCSTVAMDMFEKMADLPSTVKMKPITREEYE